MKKISSLFIVALIGSLFVLSACTQGEKKEQE